MKTKLLADFQTCASIPCEYEYDGVLFNEKIMRHKMKRIQSKLRNLVHIMFEKYHYHVLMTKDTI